MSREELIKENSALKAQLQHTLDEIAQLKRLIYGRKSERFVAVDPSPNQLSLFEDPITPLPQEAEAPKETISYERKKKTSNHAGRQLLAGCQHLPLETQTIEIPHSADAIKIGDNITELLAYRPGKLYRRQIIRPKYKELNTEQIICAELPAQAIPKCEADHSLLASIMVSKFVDHLPEYRQQEIFKRESVNIPSSTMNNWTHQIANLMRPVAHHIKAQLLSAEYIQMDESTIRVMSGKKQGTHMGYMWVVNSPPDNAVYFEYHTGRGKQVPTEILSNYSGILQTDAYGGYENILMVNKNITHAGCIAHARRKFELALTGPHKHIAESVLVQMQKLYAIESNCRENNYDLHQRLAVRQESVIILNELKNYFTQPQLILPPSSLLYKAIAYMLKRWAIFEVFTKSAIVEIDNNLIENAIRPLALGRKNYLFAGNHEAAKNIATFYTIYGTCRKLKVNPYDYTFWFLNNIPNIKINQIADVSPLAYKLSLEQDNM
ncbi:MAG: IS66 family transposase [Methylophilaceae bacterium]